MRLKCVGLKSFIHQVLNCIHSGVKFVSISLYAKKEMFVVFKTYFFNCSHTAPLDWLIYKINANTWILSQLVETTRAQLFTWRAMWGLRGGKAQSRSSVSVVAQLNRCLVIGWLIQTVLEPSSKECDRCEWDNKYIFAFHCIVFILSCWKQRIFKPRRHSDYATLWFCSNPNNEAIKIYLLPLTA